jgi:hypothetical protein
VPVDLPSGLNIYWGWPVFETPPMRRFHEQYPKLPYMAGRWTLPLEIDFTTFITDQALPESRPINLYHLTDAPGEEHNLAANPKFAETRRQLLERLVGWMKATQDPWLKYLPALPGTAK